MQNHVISKKKMNQKMTGYVKNFATFCRCFEKHSTEKKQRKRTHKDSLQLI